MILADYGAVFLMGLLGGAHCAGMCAPFALAVSAGTQGKAGRLLGRHAAYQAGKATAYASVGVLLFFASDALRAAMSLESLRQILGWLAGGAMVAIGASYALGWRWPVGGGFAGLGGAAARACGGLRALWTSPNVWRAALTGWVNGFLPCGLSLAALIFLVSRDSLGGLVAGAYVFGFGTMPALLATAWLGNRLSVRTRVAGQKALGVLLVAFGLLTVFRGSDAVHHWFHEHTVPVALDGRMDRANPEQCEPPR